MSVSSPRLAFWGLPKQSEAVCTKCEKCKFGSLLRRGGTSASKSFKSMDSPSVLSGHPSMATPD